MRPRRSLLFAVTILLLVPVVAGAQTTGQVWGEFMLDRVKNNRLTYELDLEPKVLVSAPSSQPGWWTMDVTPKVDWVAKNWLDLTGEVLTAYTRQTSEVDSFELTERFGLRFHLFSRHLPERIEDRLRGSERPAKGRVVLRDYNGVESSQPLIVLSDPGLGGPPTRQILSMNPAVVDSRAVVNVAVGGLYNVTSNGTWRIHGGFSTDRSPVGPSDTRFTKVDMQTWTVGFSGSTKILLGSFGVRYESGLSDDYTLRRLQNGEAFHTKIKVVNLGLVYSFAFRF